MIEINDTLPLIADEAVRCEAVKTARALFKTEELSRCAEFGAAVHPRAVDYLVQAPALAIAIMAGGGKLNGGRANQYYTAHKFGKLCVEGGKLRDVMAAYGYPLPLRKLHAKALSLSDEGALNLIATLPPSSLSQAIPNSAAMQRRWLSAVGAWCERMLRYRIPPDRHGHWAIVQLSKHKVRSATVDEIVDFVARGDVRINEVWEWPRAVAACRDWHDRISAGDAQKKFGILADQIVDHGDHPDHAVVDGYEFIALRTPIAIHAEGSAMRHCVGSYVSSVMGGRSHIISVQQDECRIATLEITDRKVVQLKARFNEKPSPDVRQTALAYAAQLRKAAP